MSKSFLGILKGPGESVDPIVTLKECLQHQASSHAQKEAYIFYDGDGKRTSITFAELNRQCKESSSLMKHLGIQAKDVVINALPNTIKFLLVQYGLIMIGAILLSVGIRKKDCSDLIEIVNEVNAVAVIIPTINKAGRNYNLNELIQKAMNPTLKFIISPDAETDSPGCLSLKHLMASIPTHFTSTDETTDIDEVAVIITTSGTTGSRKLVCHSYRNLYKIWKTKKLTDLPMCLFPTKLFSPARFRSLGGSPLKEVFNGTTRVTITSDRWTTDVQDMLQIAEKESCNILEMAPDILSKIILGNLSIPKSVKTVLTGGAPIQENFQKMLKSVDYLIFGYGLLETGGISVAFFTKNTTVKANSGGMPRPGVDVKIVNDNGEIVQRGVTGKIMVKTPFFSLSCLGEGRLNNGEGINTEDIGYISEKGELFVIGRQADCITIGVDTGYASEFEQVILNCGIEEISEVVVVPVPDEITYQQACACVIKTPNSALTEESFLRILYENIFDTKKPKYVLFVDSFPRNENGQVDRKLLHELATERLHLSM